MRFPEVTGRTLAGRAVTFPAETYPQSAIIVVALRQQAQAVINAWFPPLLAELAVSSSVRYYEIPMIALGFKPVARWIEGGMRGGVPVNLHDQTATAYRFRRSFCRALAIADFTVPYFFVLSPTWEIRHREQGAVTAAKVQAIRQALGDLGN